MPMSAPQRRRAEGTKASGRITKAERRRQLLACAKQLFEAHGYASATPAMVAEAAGISETLLGKYFADKQALFLEVLREVRQATLACWHAETVELNDPLAKLHAIADGFLLATRQLRLEFRIMHRALMENSDQVILASLREFFLECEALLAQVISEGQQAGVCRRSLDPRVGAWELLHNVLGHTLTLPLNLPLHQDNYLPQAADCLLHCLIKTDV
jgi:AcrR family transcriptional regulator